MSGRLRVAMLITELNMGGAERAMTSLALGLDRAEFDAALYSLGPRPEPGQHALATELERARLPIHFLNAGRSWQAARVVWQLRGELRKQPPDILLSFLYHANVIGAMAMAALPRPAARVASVRVAEPSRWRLRLEAGCLRRAAKVTCVSESIAAYVAARQNVPREKIMVIPNGVELDRFRQAEPADLTACGIGNQRRLLAVIARLDVQKGLDWLLGGIDPLLDRLPQFDLLIVGEGPLRTRLLEQAAASRHAGRIHFLGRRLDVPAILRRSELLLLPSRYEGMPNVVLEAMACGLPVAATDAEGVRELLGPEAEAQIAPRNDALAFHDVVHRLATDERLSSQVRRSNQQRAGRCFPVERMVNAYRDLFRVLALGLEKKP